MPFVEAPNGALVHYVDFDLHSESLKDRITAPVLLIHGLGCNWRHWSRQIGWLAHCRRVVAPDIRGGSGKTRWPALGWSTADMAADVHAVVAELALRHPAVVGISMGGAVALQYALDYPDDLSRLVMVDSLPGVPPEFASIREAQAAFIDSHSLREIAEERMAVAFTQGANPDTRRWVIEMIASGDLDGYRAQAHATLEFDVRDRLREIKIPTTVIHGEKDATIPSVAASVLVAGIDDAQLHILDGQGHFAHLEAPELFNPILAQALGIPTDLVPPR